MKFRVQSAAFTAALLALVPAGCDKPTAPPQPSASSTATTSEQGADATRTSLLAAAERFENLTEAAFAKDPAETAKRLALAQTEAKAAAALLSGAPAEQLQSRLATLEAAAVAHKPVDLSIAANELYRLFITAANGEPHIPLDIGLLDYAGFRFWADGLDTPPRWEDMRQALAFANRHWQAIRPRITDAKAADDFAAALTAMQKAVGTKDSQAAAKAAQQELDLVDVLEKSVKA